MTSSITAAPRKSDPLRFKVGNSLYIGGDHHQAIGPDYIIVWQRPPAVPAPQFNASFLRSAKGGLPPYRYSSSNGNIAVVDPKSGFVVATGIGTARITVIDSAGSQAGYNITFTGFVRLVQRLDDQVWRIPASEPTRPEHHALTRAQMMTFWQVYKGEDPTRSVLQILGWPESFYWAGENYLHDTTSWTVDLRPLAPDFNGVRQWGGIYLPTISRIGW